VLHHDDDSVLQIALPAIPYSSLEYLRLSCAVGRSEGDLKAMHQAAAWLTAAVALLRQVTTMSRLWAAWSPLARTAQLVSL
jgi:hypothetical protein